jgi:DNA polymerase-3 subunit epsilon
VIGTPFVIVDLETTGGSALFDRVLEVAAIRIEDDRITQRLDRLVQPGIPIPPFVSHLTGITPELLRGKPTFDSCLADLATMLDGAVVVAHNASFDCNFLLQAFKRANLAWESPRLCTLRLARRLLPGMPSYRLDTLCAVLGYPYVQRHRAGPDADATLALLRHLLAKALDKGIDSIQALQRVQNQPVSRPRKRSRTHIDEAQVKSLPTGPGVYLLKDDYGQVVYVGKSVNVRTRVRTHLRPSGTAHSPAQPRLRRRLAHVADVEAIETGSELEALLLESKLVKRYLPTGNSQLRDFHDYPFIKLDLRDAQPRLEATRERPSDGAVYFGPFRRAGVVASAVTFLSERLGLRQCTGSLAPGQSACPLLDMRKCSGPCVGAVSPIEYRARVEVAARTLRGQDTTVLEQAAERRDALAEALRFEEAADLRDRMRDLEQVIAVQQRLAAFSERNVVLVSPDRQPDRARLLLVRGGRLVEEVSLALNATPSHLRYLLRRVYRAPMAAQVSRDELDDLLIVDAWARRNRDSTHEIPIAPDDPDAAAGALRQALRTCHPEASSASQKDPLAREVTGSGSFAGSG